MCFMLASRFAHTSRQTDLWGCSAEAALAESEVAEADCSQAGDKAKFPNHMQNVCKSLFCITACTMILRSAGAASAVACCMIKG